MKPPRRPPLHLRPGLIALAWSIALMSSAAEPEMVGVLAVALEPAVTKQLELSDEQLQQLQDVCDTREMKGMSRAMKLSRLPREEQVAGLAEFRAESESLGLAILNESQAAALRQIATERDNPALKPRGVTTESTEKEEEEEGNAETPADDPPVVEASSPTKTESAPAAVAQAPPEVDGKLAFNFEQQPWGEVIRWFADRAGLSLVVDTPPSGTLNYRDNRLYTPAEALDVLNGVLLTKGFTLVRKDRMLLLIDLEQDIIPPNVVTDVPLDQLDTRGEYELVRVLIELGEVDPTAASDSLMRLIGPQGTVIALPEARMIQVTETAGRIRMMLAVIDAMRRAASPTAGVDLEVKSYPTGGGDGEVILKVLYAVLSDSQTAQMEIDSEAASLIARATPAEHAVISTTLDKLMTDGRRVEVIQVTKVDPMVAASIVTKLFDPGSGEDKKRDPNAPIIEADRYTDSLLVRGTTAQLEQIRKLVQELDAPDTSLEPGSRGTIRNLPVAGVELERALERIETLWPSLRGNPLRMTTPSGGIPSFRPGAEVESEQQEELDPLDLLFEKPNRTTATPRGSLFRFANQPDESEPAEDRVEADGMDPIYISPGVGSTVIASRDAEALDVLESLLATVLDSSAAGSRQYAVFYLKFADAGTAATLLNAIFGGGDEGGGSLMGDLAGAAVGGGGGDLLGSLLGGGGGTDSVGFDSVSVDIVPDIRLNALYVHAAADDLQTVNQLLRVIDQPRGPDRIEATGVTRLITVVNTDAAEIATVVRQVFQDRLEGSGGGGGGQPSPQEFLRAMTGGKKGAEEQEPEKITISVDERSNSLVVRSSEPLFEEVKKLVLELDRAGVERPVATRVVSLRNTSSNALRETLVSLLGDKAVVAGGEAGGATDAKAKSATPGKSSGGAEQNNAKAAEQQRREMQQGAERIRNIQRMFERARQQGGEGRGGRGGGRGGRGGGGRG